MCTLHKTWLSAMLAVGLAAFAAIQPGYAEDPTDAIAQFRAGYLYERGDGVARDYKEAMRLYLLSAAQGNPVAQFRIGYLYEKGWGVAQDDAQAMQWYAKAAIQGNSPASSRLSVLKTKHPEPRPAVQLTTHTRITPMVVQNRVLISIRTTPRSASPETCTMSHSRLEGYIRLA